MMELLSDPSAWIALFTLSALEIVLGIDNIIFISILVGRLPEAQREQGARHRPGAGDVHAHRAAVLDRLADAPDQAAGSTCSGQEFSGRDLILIAGGLFLLVKSVLEVHHTHGRAPRIRARRALFSSFVVIIVQIAVIDIVFSLDSVFTAVGLARPDQVPVMVIAIVIAVLVMMFVSGSISRLRRYAIPP